jgi:hypothetical protein
MVNPGKKTARKQARQDKQMNKQVQKFASQIKSGALNLDEMSPGMISSEMKQAAKLVESQNYSDRMRGDSETQRMLTQKQLEGMKKGGVSSKGKSFFNPGMSKSTKKK